MRAPRDVTRFEGGDSDEQTDSCHSIWTGRHRTVHHRPRARLTSTDAGCHLCDSRVSLYPISKSIETWGWIIAQEHKVAGIEIKETEIRDFLKGFSAGVKGQPSPYDSQKAYPNVERLAKARRKQVVRAIEQKNEAEARAFFDGLKLNPGVVELPGGARCEIIKRGSGPLAKPQQTVNVHYTGRLINGGEFTQFGPLDMVLVPNRSVCRGWFDAVQKINKGGTIKLYVPPPLPEDEALKWGIPPGSMMVFEIELLAIKETSAQDLGNALIPRHRTSSRLRLPAIASHRSSSAGAGTLRGMRAPTNVN